jgi:hypothetical protein
MAPPTVARRALLLSLALIAARPPAPAAALDKASRGPPQPPPPIHDRGYRLVENWDFGVTVKTVEELRQRFHTRYVYEGGKLDHLGDEWQRYDDDGTYRIAGNVLELVAKLREGMREGGIASGMLRSKWTGKHGYFECRMKAPRGRGLWPAFWLNPEDGKWPPEIDVVEIVNNGRDTTRNSFHNLHGGRPGDEAMVVSILDRWGSYHPDFDYADAFHTFAVEWTGDRVAHYVDDRQVADRRFAWRHEDGSDGGPAHVLLNLAVGGKWPGAPVSEADFPAVLQVDYIRIWQK